MSDTPREDYELRCEDAARKVVRFMDGLSEVSFEGSQAEEFGDDEFDAWDWAATMVLHMELGRSVYRIPVFSQDESGDVELGDYENSWGDTERDVWRIIWVEEVLQRTTAQTEHNET